MVLLFVGIINESSRALCFVAPEPRFTLTLYLGPRSWAPSTTKGKVKPFLFCLNTLVMRPRKMKPLSTGTYGGANNSGSSEVHGGERGGVGGGIAIGIGR